MGLRRIVGGAAIFLPSSLITWSWLNSGQIYTSISAYYYSGMRDVFVGSLVVIGTFLLTYTGYQKSRQEWVSDRALSLLAGASVLVVALLPTDIGAPTLSGQIHLVAAGVFLAAIGAISYFKFARCTNPRRKILFKALGALTLACLGLLTAGALFLDPASIPAWVKNWVFWLETTAIWAFGIAWLIKGEALEATRNFGAQIFGNTSG